MILIILIKDIKVENEKLQKWISIFDSYSYTVYLIHAVVMNGIEMLKNRFTLSQMVILLIAVVGTGVGAFVVHNVVERPMEKLGYRLLQKL